MAEIQVHNGIERRVPRDGEHQQWRAPRMEKQGFDKAFLFLHLQLSLLGHCFIANGLGKNPKEKEPRESRYA